MLFKYSLYFETLYYIQILSKLGPKRNRNFYYNSLYNLDFLSNEVKKIEYHHTFTKQFNSTRLNKKIEKLQNLIKSLENFWYVRFGNSKIISINNNAQLIFEKPKHAWPIYELKRCRELLDLSTSNYLLIKCWCKALQELNETVFYHEFEFRSEFPEKFIMFLEPSILPLQIDYRHEPVYRLHLHHSINDKYNTTTDIKDGKNNIKCIGFQDSLIDIITVLDYNYTIDVYFYPYVDDIYLNFWRKYLNHVRLFE